MRSPEEIYWGYVNWCLKIGVPPMSRPAYEKAIASITSIPDPRTPPPKKKDK